MVWSWRTNALLGAQHRQQSADKYGIFVCFNQLMCFADMLRVSGAKRADLVLQRTKWIAGSVLLTLKTRASQILQGFRPSRRVLGNFVQRQLRAGQDLVLGAGIVALGAVPQRRNQWHRSMILVRRTCSSVYGLLSFVGNTNKVTGAGEAGLEAMLPEATAKEQLARL